MHVVDDQVETIHVYMVRDEDKQPPLFLPLCVALVCLAVIMSVTMYSGSHPAYKHDTLTIPARFLPPQTFTAAQAIIPTGVKTYPATTAQGTLTITNRSVIAQILPAGFTTVSTSGVSVLTDEAVFVPAGNANGYGWATVGAYAVAPGASGNIPAVAIDRVEGTSLYIRNLSAFSGGQDSHSVSFITAKDKQTALLQARSILLSKSSGLHYPCSEDQFLDVMKMVLTWHCRFVTYRIPPYMHVSAVQLVGTHVILSVWYLPPVRPVRMR
jgi:hypothetical protein